MITYNQIIGMYNPQTYDIFMESKGTIVVKLGCEMAFDKDGNMYVKTQGRIVAKYVRIAHNKYKELPVSDYACIMEILDNLGVNFGSDINADDTVTVYYGDGFSVDFDQNGNLIK